MGDLLARTKTGYGASRANYMAELLIELLTGTALDGYVSKEMEWGTKYEPEAKAAYAFLKGVTLEDVGFVLHPTLNSGASPDALIGADGLAEFKCPNTATHVDQLLSETGEIPQKYYYQCQWQMACTGRLWCDYNSYDPRLPPAMQLWTKRVDRSNDLIEWMEDEVGKFNSELLTKLTKLRKMYA